MKDVCIYSNTVFNMNCIHSETIVLVDTVIHFYGIYLYYHDIKSMIYDNQVLTLQENNDDTMISLFNNLQ